MCSSAGKPNAIRLLVLEDPAVARVFERHGIDYCCKGGGCSIEEACASQGTDPEALRHELDRARRATARVEEPDDPVQELAPADLAAHLLAEESEGLRPELSRLLAIAARAARSHGRREPRVLGLETLLERLAARVVAHLVKEARLVFEPLARAEDTEALVATAGAALCAEHDEIRLGLDAVRDCAAEALGPRPGCPTLRVLKAGIDELHESVRRRLDLEERRVYACVCAA